METVSLPWAYMLQLPSDPRAAGIARSTLRAVLKAHRMGDLMDTVELLTSELVTNAYRYSEGPCALRIHAVEPHRLRVGVWDSNPEIPAPFNASRPAPPASGTLTEYGRGLQLVQMCADSWGAYHLGGGRPARGGKLLWVECVRKEPDCQ
jgi:anti-sigma regulatory factor (Ser/Thr protein kinase)